MQQHYQQPPPYHPHQQPAPINKIQFVGLLMFILSLMCYVIAIVLMWQVYLYASTNGLSILANSQAIIQDSLGVFISLVLGQLFIACGCVAFALSSIA